MLGVLYESYIHPITILSTLPSAGVGAVLALMLFNTEFSIIALIGVILLIGIVKKNAIMMIDFALEAERAHGMAPREAIFEACLLRFRPIMMTTSAAMLGALPLALSFGEGGELRRPLGISIVGGLMVSQVLTLYTTPVVYLYLDRFRVAARGAGGGHSPAWRPRRGRRNDASARSAPPPLEGGGWGRGADNHRPLAVGTPPPNPLPQGEGEKCGRLARSCSLLACRPAWSGRTTSGPMLRCRWRSRNCRAGSGAAAGCDGRGPWWSIYHDPELDRLERQVDVSNQTVKQFEAQYRNAVALVAGGARQPVSHRRHHRGRDTRSGSGGGGGSRITSGQSNTPLVSTAASTNAGLKAGGGAPNTKYSVEGTVDWTPDVWGSVRRQVESQVAAAQVGAADLANARLSAQTTLAADYFDLRAEDSLEVCCAKPSPPISAPIRSRRTSTMRAPRHRPTCDRAGAVGRRPGAACRRRRAAGDL